MGGVDEPIPVTREVDHGTAKLMPDVDRERAWLLTVDGAPQRPPWCFQAGDLDTLERVR